MAVTITAAAIGTAGTIYATNKAKKQQKAAINAQKEATEAADPWREYRDEAAARLDKLSKDPSSITDTATYKARLQAAERVMAAQGYTGSGNAAIAAADAGADAYQQEFNNLATLAGVASGQSAAVSAYGTGASSVANANDTLNSGYAGVANNLANIAGLVFNRPAATTTTNPGAITNFGNNLSNFTNYGK